MQPKFLLEGFGRFAAFEGDENGDSLTLEFVGATDSGRFGNQRMADEALSPQWCSGGGRSR